MLALRVAALAANVQRPPPLGDGWIVSSTHAALNLPLTFELRLSEQRLDVLKTLALSVSTPSSPRYGQHLNASFIDELTAPSPSVISDVVSWLETEPEADFRFLGRSSVGVTCTVGAAERLLRTTFQLVSHSKTSQPVLRAKDVELPRGVHAVFGVHGSTLPPRGASPSVVLRDPSPPIITPHTLAGLYQVNNGTGTRSTANRQAVIEVMGQTMKESDLSSFFAKYVPAGTWRQGDDAVYKFVGVDGRGLAGTGEPTLDIQWIMGMAPGVLSEFWLFNGGASYDFCHALLNFTQTALSADNGPLTFSVSYGFQGNIVGQFQGCASQEVSSIDDNLAKLAARGITVIVSSGDSGSGYVNSSAPHGDWCKAQGREWCISPAWPASSPWVTAVGATRFDGQVVGAAEVASDYFGSGGGFSSDFDRPSYQDAAVAHYMSSASHAAPWPPASAFPAAGRATPDVAMIGEGFRVVDDGLSTHNDGTSGSAPAFAGLVSLLNERRLASGGAPLGFLNPWLYANADAFTDITVGTNAIGRQGTGPTEYGFPCAAGWDPVTGLGTPRFDVLLQRL